MTPTQQEREIDDRCNAAFVAADAELKDTLSNSERTVVLAQMLAEACLDCAHESMASPGAQTVFGRADMLVGMALKVVFGRLAEIEAANNETTANAD